MNQNTTHRPNLATLRRWAAGTCLLVGTLLSSCGGQSSGIANPVTGDSLTAGGDNITTSFAMAGAYKGTATGSSSEFVSFLTPAPELNWYALYYLQTVLSTSIYPDIYRGTLSNTTSTSASIASPGLTAFQFRTHLVNSSPSHLSTGGGSISGASASNYQISLSDITLNNGLVNPSFSASAITSYASLPGSWTGTLTDNQFGAYLPERTLVFDSAGTTSNQSAYPPCTLNLALTPAPVTSKPYFTARLEIPAATGCMRTPTSSTTVMTGIGFIHAPSTGKKRLELILTDSTGSGISFRGDQ